MVRQFFLKAGRRYDRSQNHEDDQENEQDVRERRDVDLRHHVVVLLRREKRHSLLLRRLVEIGRDRLADVVEVQHLGELIGGHDRVLIVRLDPRLEVVEEYDRDDGDDETRGRG